MKKTLALLAIVLLAAHPALSQVGASQLKKKTNGGIVADSSNALAVGIYRGTTAPASPVIGQPWLDTTTATATLKTFNGSTWEVTPTGAGLTQADLTSFPATPTDGMIVWVRSLRRAVVYDSPAATWYYLDGTNRPAQADYSLATAGFSTSFLPSPGATTGTVTSGGSMDTGTHVCAISFYNSSGGETMVGTATSALTIATNKTASLTFAATVTGAAGKRVWCSKANTATPLFLVTTIADTTTTTYAVTVADASFGVHTSPDKDFSAPLPSGWTIQRPAASTHLYGGCGSTGTSLLCAAYGYGSSGTITTQGVRLMYGLTRAPTAWSVEARISRYVGSFPGGSANNVRTPAPLFFVANNLTDVAPKLTGLTVDSATSGVDLLPLGLSSTYAGTASRSPGAAWSVGTRLEAAAIFNLSWTAPLLVGIDASLAGGTWSLRPRVGSNGRDWGVGNVVTTTSVQEYRFAGIVLESLATSGAVTGSVIELDQFTFRSY